MTIRTHKKEKYTQISNRLINDRSLSWDARGLLIYLLSKPNGWIVRLGDLINQSPSAGRDKVKRILSELNDGGYLYRYKTQGEGGKLEWRSEIFESPEDCQEWLKSFDHSKVISTKTINGFSIDGSSVDGSSVDGSSVDGSSVDGSSVDGSSIDGQPTPLINTDLENTESIKTESINTEREKKACEISKTEPSLSPCQENSKKPETEQATALDVDRPPNSATPPHTAPSKIASKPPQNLLPTHPYPGLVEQGLESLWTGANQTGANRLRSFDPDLVTGVIEHLTKYNLPNKRGDAIGCILNAIHQGQWGKLLGWYESGKAQNAPPIDTKSLVEKAIAAESAKRSWVQSKCAEGTTPDQALRLWDSLSTQERNSLLTEV